MESGKLKISRVDEATSFCFRHGAPQLWEGLAAIAELEKPAPAALKHLWPAVSSPSRALSAAAVRVMDKNLDDAEFVLGLFAYFDLRSSYSTDEFNGWIDLMAKRDKSQKLLGKTMGVLLTTTGGVEGVPLVHNVVGLSALSRSKCGCGPVLEKYAADTGSYDRVQFKEDRSGKEIERTVTVQRFADLAKAALAR